MLSFKNHSESEKGMIETKTWYTRLKRLFKSKKKSKINSDFQPERVETDMLSNSSGQLSKTSTKRSSSLDLKRNKSDIYDVVMPYQKFIR